MSHKSIDILQEPVPDIYPQAYLQLLRERGGDAEQLIRQTGIHVDAHDRSIDDVTPHQMWQLVTGVIEQIGNDGLGFEIGLRLPPTAYGNLGYAMLCSERLEDAVRLCHRFWTILGRGMNQQLTLEPPICCVELSLITPLPEPLNSMAYESSLASFYRGLQLLARVPDSDMEIWLMGDPPPYAEAVRQRIPCVHYNKPGYQFRFNAAFLQAKLAMYNPTALKFAIRQCEQEESLLGAPLQRYREKVQQELIFTQEGYPSLHAIADQLHLTARTLRRRLEQEGTSYKILLEEAKRRDAIKLLDDHQFEIQRVAELLGYQDPANFTRAFRQWTGQTPSQYRVTRTTA